MKRVNLRIRVCRYFFPFSHFLWRVLWFYFIMNDFLRWISYFVTYTHRTHTHTAWHFLHLHLGARTMNREGVKIYQFTSQIVDERQHFTSIYFVGRNEMKRTKFSLHQTKATHLYIFSLKTTENHVEFADWSEVFV